MSDFLTDPELWSEDLPLKHFVCVLPGCGLERTVDEGHQLDTGSWICKRHLRGIWRGRVAESTRNTTEGGARP